MKNNNFANTVLPAGTDFGGLISLYNEDCLQALKRYDDKHFDIAIVDPPYGIRISSNPFRQKFEKCDWELKRKLVGFEINKGYYDNACKRLEDKTFCILPKVAIISTNFQN